MNNKIIIEQYNNIQSNLLEINAWYDLSMFNLPSLSNVENINLEDICAANINFPGVGSQREQTYFDKMIKPFNDFIIEYFRRNTSYMYLMEDNLNVQNRIRSHKGLFYKKETNNFIQKEFFFEDPYSIIAAILLLKGKNIDHLTQLYNSNSAFAICPKGQYLSMKKKLNEIVNDYISFSSNGNVINYAKIITNYCSNSTKIHRIMGDGGESCFVFQTFCIKSEMSSFILEIKQLIIDILPEYEIELCLK